MKRPGPVLGAELLACLCEQQAPVVPSAGVAARLKARVLGQVRADTRAPTPADGLATITLKAGEGEWVQLGPKVKLKLLREDTDSRSFLLRLQPGAVLPPHDHPLEEECYVLEGEVRFGDLVVQAGDYHLAPKGIPHGLVRSRTGALLFLRGANPGHGAQALST